jgi:amino acid adenylation domain-containing protein
MSNSKENSYIQHKALLSIPYDEITGDDIFTTQFQYRVNEFENKIAIKEEHRSITYGELNRKANMIARSIQSLSAEEDQTAIILTGFGIPTITAMLGILKAGKAYVSVEPSHPEERIIDILNDTQSKIIVSDDENLNLTNSVVRSTTDIYPITVINIDSIDQTTPATNLDLNISPDDYFHLIYTSGSTGKPKGVINNRRIITSKLYTSTTLNRITPDDKILLLTSTSFGASTFDVFGSLINGATLFPFPIKNRSFSQLAYWMMQEKITLYHSVPTTFRHFAKSLTGEENFPDLRLIRLGGEAIYKIDVDLYKKHFPDHCLLRISLAGTESGGICYRYINKKTIITTEIVPVGHPAEDVKVTLLDKDHNPVKSNEIGEIAVQSPFLSVGYWRRPDLNKEKFLPDPEGGDKRIFLTGDMGRFLPDGSLEHIARKDTMVKIRGLRIETSEIEAHLLASDLILDAAVVARKDRFNENRLVAYIVPSSSEQPSIVELREIIANRLPDYMIPSTFIFLDSLPLTSSGKVNKLALPSLPDGHLSPGQDFIAPRNPIESTLVNIFEKHLGVTPIGIKDNFFELGGHSLTAIQIVTNIEESLNHSIPIPEFIKALTVEKLANSLQSNDQLSSFLYLVALQTSGSKPPLFCIPPSADTAMRFETLAKYLGTDQPVYGFEYAGMDGKSEPFSTIPNMARAYIHELRLVQPDGPYYVCGLTFGGIVAYEIAQQLVRQGHKVAFLGVLDSNFYPRKRRSPLYYYILTKRFFANIRGKDLNIYVPALDRALNRFDGNDTLRDRYIHVYTINHIARMEYSSPPYPGLITRFMTDSRHARRATKGWSKATSRDMDIVSIPGYHGMVVEGQSGFMSEPNIQTMAAKLEESLDKARFNL